MAGIDVQNEAVRLAVGDEVRRVLVAAESPDTEIPEIKWGRDGSSGFLYFSEPVFDPMETTRLIRAFHSDMSTRLGELSLGQTIWCWGAGRLLNEAGKSDSNLTVYRPSADDAPGQGLDIGVVEFPVNIGTNSWRGLNIEYCGTGSSPLFTSLRPIVAWPYNIHPNVKEKDTSMTNYLNFKDLAPGIGERILMWMQKYMQDAEPIEEIRGRSKSAEIAFAATGVSIEDAFAQHHPGEEYPGDLMAKFSVIGRMVYEAWSNDHSVITN